MSDAALTPSRASQLHVERAFVMVIDLQEKLVPLVRHHERVITSTKRLLAGARLFHLPVIATEQYPKGLGPTVAAVARCLKEMDARVLEKPTFSAWADTTVRQAMLALDRPQVIMSGIEAHVCIQQTTLDLVSRDYDVFICADAVGSRGRLDYELALHRLRNEGAYVTGVESVLFELCHRCDAPEFKAMLDVIKQAPMEPV